MNKLAVYVHVPYCARKCAYCDFNAYSGAGPTEVEMYVEAVREEISHSARHGRPVSTIFFGGGTPTYLKGVQLSSIMETIRAAFLIDSDAEVSSEANPSSVDALRFREMRDAGFNRLSIGVQSFNDRILAALGRTHSADEALRSVELARAAGFRNLSIDLMFGLPGQSLEDWLDTLETATSLEVPHLSVYALTLEPGTRFERLHAGGKLTLPSEDMELEMYEVAIERLEAYGYEHYEVSNFARTGFRSQHNLVYWRNEEYAGFGPGAVSYVDGRRWTNERNPAHYAAKVSRGIELTVDSEELVGESALSETLIQGLRLREGVEIGRLSNRYAIDLETRFGERISKLFDRGLLERSNGNLRLTHRGLLFSNDVALELLP